MSVSPSVNPQLAVFFQHLRQAVTSQQLLKLVLSKYQGKDALKQLQVRPVFLKQQWHLSFTYKYQTNDQNKNFTAQDAIDELQRLVAVEFNAAHLYTTEREIQLSVSKKGKVLLQDKALTQQQVKVSTEHNREKHRYLSLQRPFLRELGVTDASAQLIPAMSKKWKQINKFIEIFSGAVTESGLASREQLHVADFGSGKAYLTFAMHDYLSNTLALDAQVTGVELRQALVDHCNQTADKLRLKGIQFEQGDVKHFKARGINVMIALHACDTATDYAIHMGIATGAEIIMCSPCCHKELRPQLTPPTVLAGPLSFGIHLGQEAEMITDSLRAMLLQANGYDTKVFEFISLEHTSKNKMILAIKRKKPAENAKILQQIADIKQFYGIKQQCLETLLLEAT